MSQYVKELWIKIIWYYVLTPYWWGIRLIERCKHLFMHQTLHFEFWFHWLKR